MPWRPKLAGLVVVALCGSVAAQEQDSSRWITLEFSLDQAEHSLSLRGETSLPDGTKFLYSVNFGRRPIKTGALYARGGVVSLKVGNRGDFSPGEYTAKLTFHPGLQLPQIQQSLTDVPPFQATTSIQIGDESVERVSKSTERRVSLEGRLAIKVQFDLLLSYILALVKPEEVPEEERSEGARPSRGGGSRMGGGDGGGGSGGPVRMVVREAGEMDGTTFDPHSFLAWFEGWSATQDRNGETLRRYRQEHLTVHFPEAFDNLESTNFLLTEMGKAYGRRLFRHHGETVPVELMPPGRQEFGFNDPERMQAKVSTDLILLYRQVDLKTQGHAERVVLVESIRGYESLAKEIDEYVSTARNAPADEESWRRWRREWGYRFTLRRLDDSNMAAFFVELADASDRLDALAVCLRSSFRASFVELYEKKRLAVPADLLDPELPGRTEATAEFEREKHRMRTDYGLKGVEYLIDGE